MSATPSEPRNPLYLLFLVVSFAFVVTALAYALVPTLEEKAALAGQAVPSSPFRDSLRHDGWIWLLYELAAMIVLGLASMGLDRWRLRGLQNTAAAGTMPATGSNPQPSAITVPHDHGNTTGSTTSQRDQPS